jgi:glycosyltransferase involved in cell wall biosynthesis
LKYALSLYGKDFTSDFFHFHRLEPTLFTQSWKGHRTLFVHNDIHQQMKAGEAQGILWRRFPQLYFMIERLLLPQFNKILSCNSESTELYQKQYPKLSNRISFVRNSFDGHTFYPLFGEERDQKRRQQAIRLGLKEDTRFLLFAGRLHPQKDPLRLLEALSLMTDPRVHLLVAGDGELSLSMRERAERLGIAKQVTFLGPLSLQKLAEFQRLANVFVLTSAYEGLPVVVLEALASGTPIVTTKSGETPRLLKPNCGIVCGDRDPETIAQALDTVLQSPEKFPSEACIQNAAPYSAENVIKQIYEDMLQSYRLDYTECSKKFIAT